MERKTKNLVKLFASIGAMFTMAGCTITVPVAGNFKGRTVHYAPVPEERVTVVAPTPAVVTRPVVRTFVAPAYVPVAPIYAPAPIVCGGVYRGGRIGGGFGGGYRGGRRGSLNPTAGTHLGNTMDGTTRYRRNYNSGRGSSYSGRGNSSNYGVNVRTIWGPNSVGINPTGGTHLGNTMDGTTRYYRNYRGR